MVEDDTAPALDLAEAHRLIEAQRSATVRGLSPDPRMIFWPWGVAWLVGFGLLFLRHGPREEVRVDMPAALPLATLFALMVVAFVVSTVAGVRATRQITGDSASRGLKYGLAWFAGFAANGAICGHFSNLLSPPETGLLWGATSVALVGLLYMAGSAIWQARELFVLGIWLTISNIAGVVAGAGWHSLVISLAGGGGLLVAGLIEWLRWRRHP